MVPFVRVRTVRHSSESSCPPLARCTPPMLADQAWSEALAASLHEPAQSGKIALRDIAISA
jgi:hypothetical protein